jgi:hypothetical protein
LEPGRTRTNDPGLQVRKKRMERMLTSAGYPLGAVSESPVGGASDSEPLAAAYPSAFSASPQQAAP